MARHHLRCPHAPKKTGQHDPLPAALAEGGPVWRR